jgi:hypothetical protein
MKADQAPDVIKLFLLNPEPNFKDFFEVCYRLTLGYLRYLQKRGVKLPTDQWAGQHPLNDLALDVLGTFFRSAAERKYVVIFEYFEGKGQSDFSRADPNELYDLFKTLIFGYIKQELRRICRQADPQIENLKRRFEEILDGPDYKTCSSGGGSEEHIRLADSSTSERDNLPTISYEQLLAVVEEAYCSSFSRTEWCRNVFLIVKDMDKVRNCLRKNDLIGAAVATNIRHVETYGIPLYAQTRTDDQMQLSSVEDAKRETLAWLSDNVLHRFVEKKRISAGTAEKFMQAADIYLTDKIYSFETDKLPAYFREVMPNGSHDKYLSDYKYCFETAIRQAEENFAERVKKIL